MASWLGFRAPRVQALVGELRSCKLPGGTKNKKCLKTVWSKQTKSRKVFLWKLKCHSCVYISTTSDTLSLVPKLCCLSHWFRDIYSPGWYISMWDVECGPVFMYVYTCISKLILSLALSYPSDICSLETPESVTWSSLPERHLGIWIPEAVFPSCF